MTPAKTPPTGVKATPLPPDQWTPIRESITAKRDKRNKIRDDLNDAQGDLDHDVERALDAGATPTQIAVALEISTQSVYKRYVTSRTK